MPLGDNQPTAALGRKGAAGAGAAAATTVEATGGWDPGAALAAGADAEALSGARDNLILPLFPSSWSSSESGTYSSKSLSKTSAVMLCGSRSAEATAPSSCETELAVTFSFFFCSRKSASASNAKFGIGPSQR